jgi:5-methylcytosine-specific restriction endonuclease McrA
MLTLEAPYTEEYVIQETDAIIRKVGDKFVLFSHSGKELGEFDSKEAALKREKQINYFKHTNADDTYHSRFAPDRKHNKGSKKYKPLEKKCVKCGTRSGQLDINHKDGNRKNNNRSNLNYMCRSCHRKMHAKKNGGKGHVVELISQGSIFEPTDGDKAQAGFQNADLMYVKFELCHTGANKNTDGFINDEMKSGHITAVNKPINWEHTSENIGTIYETEYQEKDGQAAIIAKAVIWKHKHPERARAIAQRYSDSDLFFSMETYFQKAKCSACSNEYESPDHYCDHLSKRMETKGEVTRWLIGLNFIGAGCVKNPADPKAVGLAVAAKNSNYSLLIKTVEAMKLDITHADWLHFLASRGELND